MIYQVGDLTVNTIVYRLSRDDKPIDVEPQVFNLLAYLIENRDRVVTRDELLNTLWKGKVVSDSALGTRIKAARKAIGDTGNVQNIIKTIHGRGYQFIAPVITVGNITDVKKSQNQEDRKPSIYVNKFQCSPEDGESRALAEELYDQILQRLSRRTGVRLLEMTYKNNEETLGSTDYLLNGRIRKSMSEYRVNFTMTWCASGETVWAEGFSGSIKNPLSFADSVIHAVDAALRIQFNAFDARRLADRDESNLSVSELLTKAAECSYRVNISEFRHAVVLIDRILKKQPDNPMALAMRAEFGATLANILPEDFHDEDNDALIQMADRAIELNHLSDYAFFARGSLRLMRLSDIDGALEDAKRCLELSPSYVDGFDLTGRALTCLEKADQAIEYLERAVKLSKSDPYYPSYLEQLALARFFCGNLGNALIDIDSALQFHSGVWTFHRLKGAILEKLGEKQQAEESFESARKLIGTPHIFAIELPLPPSYKQLLKSLA